MVKEGFTCITVPKSLYQELKEISKNNGLSISKLIGNLLANSTSTCHKSTSISQENLMTRQSENKPQNYSVSSNTFSVNGCFPSTLLRKKGWWDGAAVGI